MKSILILEGNTAGLVAEAKSRLALNIIRTNLGKNHALLKDRTDGYSVPCAHRDEVPTPKVRMTEIRNWLKHIDTG